MPFSGAAGVAFAQGFTGIVVSPGGYGCAVGHGVRKLVGERKCQVRHRLPIGGGHRFDQGIPGQDVGWHRSHDAGEIQPRLGPGRKRIGGLR